MPDIVLNNTIPDREGVRMIGTNFTDNDFETYHVVVLAYSASEMSWRPAVNSIRTMIEERWSARRRDRGGSGTHDVHVVAQSENPMTAAEILMDLGGDNQPTPPASHRRGPLWQFAWNQLPDQVQRDLGGPSPVGYNARLEELIADQVQRDGPRWPNPVQQAQDLLDGHGGSWDAASRGDGLYRTLTQRPNPECFPYQAGTRDWRIGRDAASRTDVWVNEADIADLRVGIRAMVGLRDGVDFFIHPHQHGNKWVFAEVGSTMLRLLYREVRTWWLRTNEQTRVSNPLLSPSRRQPRFATTTTNATASNASDNSDDYDYDDDDNDDYDDND